MKKYFKFGLMICILALPLFLFAQGNLQEGAEVVASFSWGDGDNEIGLVNMPEVERGGPLSFSASGKELLVLDSAKLRAIKIEEGNKFSVVAKNVKAWDICSDGSGGFFAVDEDKIIRYSDKGELQESFKAPSSKKMIMGYGSSLSLSSGEVFFNNVDQKTFPIAKGSADKGFAAEPQDSAKVLAGKPGTRDGLSFIIKRLAGDDIRILGTTSDGKDLVSVKIKTDGDSFGAVLFKGQDLDGNLYVEIERLKNNRALLEVQKYSTDGRCLKIFLMPNNYFTTVHKKTEITVSGDVYQMFTTAAQFQIIRYR